MVIERNGHISRVSENEDVFRVGIESFAVEWQMSFVETSRSET